MHNKDKIFIHESLWSKTYKIGNYIEKEYKQPVEHAVKREINNSLLAHENSILTPYCYGYRVEKGVIVSKFDYWEMDKVCLESKLKEAVQLTEKLQTLPFSSYDTIAERIGTPAAKIISFTIKTYYNKMQICDLENIVNEFKNNPVVMEIVKARVLNYVYNNYVSPANRQVIGQICNLKLVDNGFILKKKK